MWRISWKCQALPCQIQYPHNVLIWGMSILVYRWLLLLGGRVQSGSKIQQFHSSVRILKILKRALRMFLAMSFVVIGPWRQPVVHHWEGGQVKYDRCTAWRSIQQFECRMEGAQNKELGMQPTHSKWKVHTRTGEGEAEETSSWHLCHGLGMDGVRRRKPLCSWFILQLERDVFRN